MNIGKNAPDGRSDEYMVGWFDGIAAAQLSPAIKPPTNHLVYRCQDPACGRLLEVGEAVNKVSQDAFGNALWAHLGCTPPRPDTELARAEAWKPADTGPRELTDWEQDLIASVTTPADPPEDGPGGGMAVLRALQEDEDQEDEEEEGTPIIAPLTGYDLFLARKYGVQP